MDANFRLKNHLVSNLSSDPGLWNGMAYMTPRAPYEAYVLSQADAEDVSTSDTAILHVLIMLIDQHLCRLPGPCKGDNPKYSWPPLHRHLRCHVWPKRNDFA